MDGRNPILVVDDDEDIRLNLAECLTDEGYEVMAARNGREALDALSRSPRPPALILLDLFMPILDGRGFLSEMSRLPSPLKEIPVVVLTAAGDRNLPLGESPSLILRKPVELDRLLDVVAGYCVA